MSVLSVVSGPTRTLRWRSLAVDLDTRSLAVSGRRLPATDAEFGLVRLLLNHRSQPMTKAVLLDGIFGPGHGRDHRLADALVFRVRRCLAAAGLADPIVAVAGRGYALADDGAADGEPVCPTYRTEPSPAVPPACFCGC